MVIDTGSNRLEVTVRVPAGFAHAALEIRNTDASWRTGVSGVIDGRAATVILRWPRSAGVPSAIVRVRCGAQGEPPAAELNDPALYTVIYDDPAGAISEEVKLDNLKILMRKHAEWSALNAAERNNNLIAHARTLPNVSGAGFSALAGTVYLNYPDGDTCVIIDNRGEETLISPAPLPQVQALAKALPQSVEAICAYSLEPEVFPDSTQQVTTWLRNAGYTVHRTTALTVDDIMGWKDRKMGVLFWQAHAGSLQANSTAPEEMCIVTGQVATAALSQGKYKAMRSGPVRDLLLAARPDLANPANLDGIPIYAITPNFIKTKLTGMFGPNSMFALDACTGAHPDLSTLFIAHGAGAHISWNDLAGPDSGMRFRQLFDRLTGANSEAPLSLPAERPFRHEAVQHWMQTSNLILDPSPQGTAKLSWTFHGADPAYALVPSIYRVLYEARDNQYNFTKLKIEGDFGKDPGAASRLVSWGGTPVEVLDWDEQEGIRIRPPVPPYPLGDMQVFIGSRKSNAVPMTEWSIPFSYTLNGEGSLKCEINFTVKLRADIRRGRALPQEEGRAYPVVMSSLADCTGTLKASGTYQPDEDTTITWSGTKNLTSSNGSNQGPVSDFILAAGVVDTATGRVNNFFVSVASSFTETTNGKEKVRDASLSPYVFLPSPVINLQTSVFQGQTVPPPAGGDGSATLSWGAAQGTPALTPDTPR